MSNFSFNVPRSYSGSDRDISDAVDPLYSAMRIVYNNFVYSCGVITPPSSDFPSRLTDPAGMCQPQNLNRFFCLAGENITAGKLVYLYLDSGTLKAKLAVGGAYGKKAVGYVNYGGTTGETLELILGFGVLPVAGAAPETEYYLSDSSAGSLSPTAPGSGVIQLLATGIAEDLVYIHCF